MKRIMATLLFTAGLLFGTTVAAGAASATPVTASAPGYDCYPNCHHHPATNHLATTPPATTPPASVPPASLKTATGLAFTGTDAEVSAGFALVLLAAGFVLVRASRRRSA